MAGGFENGQKQDYQFRIEKIGETGRRAPHYDRLPTFRAVAEPLDPETDRVFFSVDELGEVRCGSSLFHLLSAAIWDYADRTSPRVREITYSS